VGVPDVSENTSQNFPDYPGTREDFRATAMAFSQLAGVLGGFSITILVLVLSFLSKNKDASDWSVALLLLASTSYIYGSGMFANSMNVRAIARTSRHPADIDSVQVSTFRSGLWGFHIGNVLLPVAIVIIVFQESLWIGVVASIMMCFVAWQVVGVNYLDWRRLSRSEEGEEVDGNQDAQGQPVSPALEPPDSPSGNGLGWPDVKPRP
jgi:hypothetical protein